MPGGSQNLCTGSLVLSIVWRAPKGGLTLLNFSAAQGVIGAFSGCWANGSDESQVFSLMPSGPWKSGSQMPDRSGIPADAVGAFAPAEPSADWAHNTREKLNSATVAAIKTSNRIRILPNLRASWTVRFNLAGKCAIGSGCLLGSSRKRLAVDDSFQDERDRAGNSNRSAIAGGMGVDHDVVASFHGILAPPGAHHMDRGGAFDRLVLPLAAVILRLHIDYDVRIAPVELGHRPMHGNRLRHIISSNTVVRERRHRQH